MAKVTLTPKTSAMKSIIPLFVIAIAFSSCTTAYKSGQTPDDVYYSPARPEVDYVRQEKRDDRRYRYDEEAYRDDRYLRMKIRDRRYVGLYDDYYSYNPYYYHYYNGSLIYNSPWTSYTYWNQYYNPYCTYPVIIKNPGKTVYNKPRQFDLSLYNGGTPANTLSPKGSRNFGSASPRYRSGNNSNNYRGSGTNAGGFLRDVFGTGSSSGSSSGSNSSKSSSSSSSSSSSGSGSKGNTNAPARKF
jgi:hypothetical protein